MNDATLQNFQNIAQQLIGKADWQWIGPHMSQRMFGVTEKRAKEYQAKHGGEAKKMA